MKWNETLFLFANIKYDIECIQPYNYRLVYVATLHFLIRCFFFYFIGKIFFLRCFINLL